MARRRATRILLVDNPDGSLSTALLGSLQGHEVEVASDAFDAIYRVDGDGPPYDLIFCDLSRPDLPGPELWAYFSLGGSVMAERMVFVASGPLPPETSAFLAQVPNPCVRLDRSPGLASFFTDGGASSSSASAAEPCSAPELSRA